MISLLQKAWIESRIRFLTGMLLVTGISVFFVFSHGWIVHTWLQDRITHPEWVEPPWLPRATGNYSFYLWHFLPDSLFQQAWAFCAVLLGIGGLRHEQAEGSVGFTLSLPATRRALFLSRMSVGLLECVALAMTPALLSPLFSLMVGQEYAFSEGALHCVRMLLGGLIVFAFSTFLASALESAYLAVFIGLSTLAVLYLFIQPYAGAVDAPAWIRAVDIRHLMAGPEYSPQWASQPWFRLAGSMIGAAAILTAALLSIERRDF